MRGYRVPVARVDPFAAPLRGSEYTPRRIKTPDAVFKVASDQ